MLVEDEFLIRLTLSEVLGDEGYTVIEAESGDEALIMLRANPSVDVLLTDVQLPGVLDGYALVAQARQTMPALPVIFMTGRPDRLAGRPKSPIELHLAKPYRPSDVCNAIRSLLKQAEA